MATYFQNKYCPSCKKTASGKDNCKKCGAKLKKGKWNVQFYSNTTPVKLSGFNKKSEAEFAYINYCKEHGDSTPITNQNITFNELIKDFLQFKKTCVSGSTYEAVYRHITTHIVPFFGNMKVKNVTPEIIKKWVIEFNTKTYGLKNMPYSHKYKNEISMKLWNTAITFLI